MSKLELNWKDNICSHYLILKTHFNVTNKVMCDVEKEWGNWELIVNNAVSVKSDSNGSLIQIRLSATKTSEPIITNTAIYVNYRDRINIMVDSYRWGICDICTCISDTEQKNMLEFTLDDCVKKQIDSLSNKSHFLIKCEHNICSLWFMPEFDRLDNRSFVKHKHCICEYVATDYDLHSKAYLLNKLHDIANDIITFNHLRNVTINYD